MFRLYVLLTGNHMFDCPLQCHTSPYVARSSVAFAEAAVSVPVLDASESTVLQPVQVAVIV